MSLPKTGDQTVKDLLNSQRNFSLNDSYFGEQWLLQNGLVTETSMDTLMGYAYMQKGVATVAINLDLDLPNNSKDPKVSFKVKLQKGSLLRYEKMKTLMKSKTLWGKLKFYIYLKLGSPIPGIIEDNIMYLTRSYLPPNYKIEIELQ